MITPDDIYSKTNNGLDIILYYYPQAREALEGNKLFKLRDEKTASASIKQFNNVYKVTDFGDDGRAIGPIDICMREENLSFTEAIFRLADRYNVEKILSKDVNKANIEKRPATNDEEEGHFSFELNKDFTENELRILVPKGNTPEELAKIRDACKRYSWFSVKYYTRTKNRETIIIKSNENYPIFLRDCGDFKKIYQPLNPDKGFRFFYVGKKPAEYINGLDELKKAYTSMNKTLENEWNNAGHDENESYIFTKMKETFICSGERDALCVAALGYYPIWFNSETYRLSEREYNDICKYTERIYNIPDLDETGVKKGIELGMKFLDIFTIWLPEWLKTYKDMRGRPRKDLRDFIELRPVKKYFNELMNVAMPMRFWEMSIDDKGRKKYDINTEYVYHFLRCNGFATIEDKNSKTGKMFVRVEKNVVKEVFVKDIRNFLRTFMKDRYMDISLRNMVNNSKRLTDSVLDAIDEINIDFSDFTKDSQLFFFENKTWEVTASGIKELDPNNVKNYVWAEEVIPHRVKRIDSAFEINCDPDSDLYDIQISHKQSNFFKYLINSSRVFWRKELEEEVGKMMTIEEQEQYRSEHKFDIAGPLLSFEEQNEQKRHLINKIFCIGYLLHRYKSDSRAWCVFAMDNKIGSIEDSNGRSGKSFCFKTPRLFMKSVTLSGRNRKLTDNPHIYDRVTEYTDMVLIDDANAYLDFDFFFDVVTGDMTVNPKNNKSYEIPFEKAPKFCITSNYTLRKVDPSTEGRILYAVFSDYYHQKTADNDYRETRSIYDDFGKNLLRDYTDDEWNADINFFAECCQFYLSIVKEKQIKIQPPMTNVVTRNLITQMGGDIFINWADIYFCEDGENVDKLVPKEEAFRDFMETSKVKMWTTQTFTKSLRAYCKYAPHILELDPIELKKNGRIIRKHNNKSTEMIYVRTKESIDARNIESSENNENYPF